MAKYKIVSVEPDIKDTYHSVITLEKEPSFYGKIAGFKPVTKKFRGNCTVWLDLSNGLRAGCNGNALHDLFIGSTAMESFLFKIWRENKSQLPS